MTTLDPLGSAHREPDQVNCVEEAQRLPLRIYDPKESSERARTETQAVPQPRKLNLLRPLANGSCMWIPQLIRIREAKPERREQ